METAIAQPKIMVAPIDYNPDRTGYRFCQKVEGQNVLHPGVDLNGGNSPRADLGMKIVAPADGKVIYSSNSGKGWGRMLVIQHKALSCFSRIAHFQQIEVLVGDEVKMGQEIGLCGESGTTSPHCHWELIGTPLGSWTMYPHGWTEEEVKEVWLDPLATMEKFNATAQIPAELMPAVKWAVEMKIATDWSNPAEIVANAVQESIYFNAGLLKDQVGYLTKLRSVVALYRAVHGEKVR